MNNTVKVFVRAVGVIIDIIGIFRKRSTAWQDPEFSFSMAVFSC